MAHDYSHLPNSSERPRFEKMAQKGRIGRHGLAQTAEASYDITNDYDWTSIPTGSKYREEAPSAMVVAYELEFGQLQQFIDGYINLAVADTVAAASPGLDPGMAFYRNLYKTTQPISTFNFPFFSDEIRGFTTEFTDSFSPISQRGAKFVGAKPIMGLGTATESLVGGGVALINEGKNMGGNSVSNALQAGAQWGGEKISDGFEKLTGLKMPGLTTVGAPGSYIETPQFYQYSNTDNALDINFVLSNTMNGKEGYEKNQSFIKEFTKMNRPRRLGAVGMTFPAIYHIQVPGLRYIQWAFLNNFSVHLMGSRRKIDGEIVPEAFKCQFSFRSLTVEAANFVDEIENIGPYNTGDNSFIIQNARDNFERAKTIKDLKERARQLKLARAAAAGQRYGNWEMENEARKAVAQRKMNDAQVKEADANNDGEITGDEIEKLAEIEDRNQIREYWRAEGVHDDAPKDWQPNQWQAPLAHEPGGEGGITPT